jgi:hypothetical protein
MKTREFSETQSIPKEIIPLSVRELIWALRFFSVARKPHDQKNTWRIL